MRKRDELRAKAKAHLERAKAAEASSESLVHLLHALECDTEAYALEQAELPPPHVIDQQTGGNRESA
jgi:hypothetical protein